MSKKAAVDPLVNREYLTELAGAYLNGTSALDTTASPLYADLRGLPPTLIQVGSAETLLDDAIRLAGVAGAADLRVTLEVWPDMIHAWDEIEIAAPVNVKSTARSRLVDPRYRRPWRSRWPPQGPVPNQLR